MRTLGVSLGKIPLFGRRRADIMISFSHCQGKKVGQWSVVSGLQLIDTHFSLKEKSQE
jgi:hypothetical protein